MNYYQTQSTYFLLFIALAALAFAILPTVFSSFSEASDDFAISKMNHIQAEIIIEGYNEKDFKDACDTGFLSSMVYEVEREVVCRINEIGNRMMAYIELSDGFFYVIDSEGVSCTLPDKPRPDAVDCKHALKNRYFSQAIDFFSVIR